jgi:hypothetical protein
MISLYGFPTDWKKGYDILEKLLENDFSLNNCFYSIPGRLEKTFSLNGKKISITAYSSLRLYDRAIKLKDRVSCFIVTLDLEGEEFILDDNKFDNEIKFLLSLNIPLVIISTKTSFEKNESYVNEDVLNILGLDTLFSIIAKNNGDSDLFSLLKRETTELSLSY